MKRRRIFALTAWLAAALALAIGLSQLQISRVQAQQGVSLTVSAAISLKESLQELKQTYQRSQPNVAITYNFGASGALQQQIEQGAPVDIFFSAAAKQIDALQSKGLLLEGSRKNLLGNRIVLVVPSNSKVAISDFKSLTISSVKKIAVGEPRSVPAGQYAEEIFKSMGMLEQIKSKLVYGNNVRQVLTFVETGNVDAGIVYITDAKASNQVKVAATAPQNSHSPIVYPVAVIKSSKNPNVAKGFLDFLSSSNAKAVFTKYGFIVL